MTQKVSILDSGGHVQVRESIIRGSGPEGPIGPRGPKGSSLRFRGQVATLKALPALNALPGGPIESGDGVLVEDSGHLWTWFAMTPDSPMEWHDAGRFRGSPGYLMSVMARCELAASYGSSMGINAGYTYWPEFDIVHNDTELQGEGMSGVKTVVLGLSDKTGPLKVAKTNCSYLIHGWPQGMTDAADIQTNPSTMGNGATYLITVKAQFTPVSAGRGIFKVHLLSIDFTDGGRSRVVATSTDDSEVQPETVTLVALVKHHPGLGWRVSMDTTLSGRLTAMEISTARLGGGYGPKGTKGEPGPRPVFTSPYAFEVDLKSDKLQPGHLAYATDTGNLWSRQTAPNGTVYWELAGHVQGKVGNPSAGYASYDAVAGLTGPVASEGAPGSAGHTKYEPQQGLPYPNHSTEPHTPYFIKTLVKKLAGRIVSRYSNWADFNSKRPNGGEPGEVLYVKEIEKLFISHGRIRQQIPTILIRKESLWPPPSDGDGTSLPDGTIWLQVKH